MMAENSKIQWTDHTFNPWRGCTKVSPGCKNCYAETLSGRNPKMLGVWGPEGKRIVASESMWKEPVKWNRAAGDDRARVFCASLADVFEDWRGPMLNAAGDPLFGNTLKDEPWTDGDNDRPGAFSSVTMDNVRARLFRLIDATPNLDWLILTKRPENALRMTYDAWTKPVPGHVSQNEGDGRHWHWPKNVWLGVSVEDQLRADERIPILMNTPATVRFLSCEPLLGPINLRQTHRLTERNESPLPRPVEKLDWVIVGGESGPGARPMNVAWARSIIEQCQAAGVPCFMKQLGSVPMWTEADIWAGATDKRYDKKGGNPAEWPQDLRVRQFPTVTP